MTFKDLTIAEPVLAALCEKGYDQPTPIQEKAIPVALQGADVLGIAQTGTGKTAAFAIPVLEHLYQNNRRDTVVPAERKGKHSVNIHKREVRALILTPTRELALQIGDSFAEYGKYTGLKHCVIFGGVKQKQQTDALKSGVDILIATPGRLLDLMGQGFIRLNALSHFILDEADRMLDMGFIHDIRRIVPQLPANRQTLFFSATMPQEIASLSRSILHNPVRVEVTPVSSTVDTIEQQVYMVEKPQKKELLISVLRQERENSVLVFSRTKRGADQISRVLNKAGIQSQAIHGAKSQVQRQRTLTDFKSGKIKVMIATDIAARGLDINQLGMVINYDLPDVAETYVHRIGRTGRAGYSGKALLFCSGQEHGMVRDIQKLTGKKLDIIRMPA